jgi:succinyl-diaminopimelate desuccinylase
MVTDLGRDRWGPAFAEERPAVPFFTDAAEMQPFWRCPVAIVGPGEPQQAHRTDESCDVDSIRESAQWYAAVIDAWCS